MNVRMPPRLAMWFLRQLTGGYQSESLAGDLFEEYQQGRSRLWYWMQVLAAVVFAGARAGRSDVPRSTARALRRLSRRLIAIFALTALGVGTITWAATTFEPSCTAHASACHKTR